MKRSSMSNYSSLTAITIVALLFKVSFASNLREGELQWREGSQPSSRDLAVGACGSGNIGNGICEDSSLCCSEFGYCGTGAAYCGEGACGWGTIGNGICEDSSLCCSIWGYCGTGVEYCGGGTCGGGSVGNGLCEDRSLCCSKFGYCGTGALYCGEGPTTSPLPQPTPSPLPQPTIPTLQPAPSPTSPSPPTNHNGGEHSRLIAYLGNWQTCPSDAQLDQYTHIVIAFAVSYQWSPGKNICSQTCEIGMPPVCDNASRPDLIKNWQDAGKKVILSFGGAGMGGSWAGDQNDCWEYCYGREAQVVNRLTEIVNEMGLDGIDIDYEYFHEDNPNFSKGTQAQNFLKEVTVGLRNSMAPGAELTHAPMEPDMTPGRGYFNVLKDVSYTLDFLMPQYYNGFVNPKVNFPEALSHYTTLTKELFDGDATKVVFGFCINECGGFNHNGPEAASVMSQLSQNYSCNGGAFFWVANADVNGQWSIPVKQQLQIDDEQCSGDNPVPSPTLAPVPVPTIAPLPLPTTPPVPVPTIAPLPLPTTPPVPVPTIAPLPLPTTPPVPPVAPPVAPPTSVCEDDSSFRLNGKKRWSCKWVGKKKTKKRCKKRHKIGGEKKERVNFYCPKTCGMCH